MPDPALKPFLTPEYVKGPSSSGLRLADSWTFSQRYSTLRGSPLKQLLQHKLPLYVLHSGGLYLFIELEVFLCPHIESGEYNMLTTKGIYRS